MKRLFGLAWLAIAAALPAAAQSSRRDTTSKLEIYGFGQADLIFDFQRNDPNWFDVNRPTKLPKHGTQFNANGNSYLSARQSRFGAKGRKGDVFANFDFDMFGVGVDAGQTTIRLRHAYGQWGKVGAGQLESPFMDLDVFPNILDYWGPNGMLFFRNVQVFWEPINDDHNQFRLALERPGASGDAGIYADRISIDNVKPRFPYPDLSMGYRYGGTWGHVKLSGIVRDIHWEQIPTDTFDLSGHVTGWGFSLSSNVKFAHDVVRLQAVYGEGIQNYFNDAPVDVGLERNLQNARTPVSGEALPIFGGVVFVDHTWNSTLSTSAGWSVVNITNSPGQTVDAFHNGQYGTLNLLWTPVTNVMMGSDFQWGYRRNFSDGFTFNDYRMQFSFKYSFSQTFGGKP
jgi:hypothetical protein